MMRRRDDSLEANMAGNAELATSTKRYQVKLLGQWIEAQSGVRVMEEFLYYELEDGTTGMARPSDWRLNRTIFKATKRIKKATG